MLRVNNVEIKIGYYPDGTLDVKAIPVVTDKVLLTWNFKRNEEYLALAFLNGYYKARGITVDLFMPYIPYARMDRVELIEDVFSLKYFGKLINALEFNKVYVWEPHSSVAIAAIDNCNVFNCINLVNKAVIKDIMDNQGELLAPCLFFPDEGAMKRYATKFNLPYAFGIKKRDWKTGKIVGLDVVTNSPDDIKGKNILIVDDICSRGGTFYHSAKKLKEMGAKNIYLYVTHCEQSVFDGELIKSGLIKKIYTTNSIFDVRNLTLELHKKLFNVVDIDMIK